MEERYASGNTPVVKLYVNHGEGDISPLPYKYHNLMKHLFLFLLLALSITSCKNEERVTFYEDMFYFTKKLSSAEGYISPITTLSAKSNSQVELLVWRNAFAAKDHPNQNVQIIVDQKLSTAEVGHDFSISDSSLDFKGNDNTSIPISVDTHSATGKTIVLQLVYEYYNECPADTRRSDRLKINIK